MQCAGAETIVQRAVDTDGGTFDTSRYEAVYIEDAGEANDTALGADIKLSFLPNQKVEDLGTTQVGLIQTVKTLQSTEARPGQADTPNTPEDSPNKAAYKLTAEEGDLGRGIDKRDRSAEGEANTNPLYAAENKAGRFPASLGESAADAGLGAHWFSAAKDRPAELFDKPRVTMDFAEQIWKMSFEVAAVITGGELTGTYLGSIAWGWKKDADKETELSPEAITLVSKGVPSKNFLRAGKKWNTWNEGARTGQDGRPHDVVEVPINKARLFDPDKSGLEDSEVIKDLADLLTLQEFNFPRMDGVEKQNALYEIKILMKEIQRREPSEDDIDAAVTEVHSADTVEQIKSQAALNALIDSI